MLPLLVALIALGADWPHLRGPLYDGISAETGLADSWPEGGPPLLWSREMGQGYSGFVVAEGRAYTQRQTATGQYLLCLDPDTGKTLWETRYDWAWQPGGAYPGPYASPTVAGGKVYFASPTGLVGCMDAATGVLVWSLNVRTKFEGIGTEFGYAATPLVEAGLVVLPVGGVGAAIVALHADDGRTAWRSGNVAASYCPAFPITLRGRRLVAVPMQNTLIVAELATGKILAKEELSDGYDEHSAWPLWREPDLLVASPFQRGASCLRLTPDGEGIAARQRWGSRDLSNDIVSSVLYRGHVYGFDLKQLQASRHKPSRGVFRCLDWETGKVRWSSKEVGQASAVAADGKLLLLNDGGELILARADPGRYTEAGRARLFDEICWTPPSLWRGRLLVRSPSRAACVFVGRPEDAPESAGAIPPARAWQWASLGGLLFTREREYPNDAFSRDELYLWFGACLAILALCWPLPRRAYWPAVFVLGLLGPNLISWWVGRCVFTWPVSMYAAFHLAVSAGERAAAERRGGWWARGAVAGFALAAWGYFEGCRLAGMFVAWAFLFGFPAAFPFAWLAARSARKGQWWGGGWAVLGFAAFFWGGQALLWWKSGP